MSHTMQVPRYCATVDKLRQLPPNREVVEFTVGEKYLQLLPAMEEATNEQRITLQEQLDDAYAEAMEQIQRLIALNYTIDVYRGKAWTTRAPRIGDEVSPYREDWLHLHSSYQENMVEESAPEEDTGTHQLTDLATSQEAFDIVNGLDDGDRTITRPLTLWDIHESWEMMNTGTAHALENAAPGKGHWTQCFALLRQYGPVPTEVEAAAMETVIAHARGLCKQSQLWAMASNVKVWVTEPKKHLRNGRVSPYTVVGER